jgi:hypothetical protein
LGLAGLVVVVVLVAGGAVVLGVPRVRARSGGAWGAGVRTGAGTVVATALTTGDVRTAVTGRLGAGITDGTEAVGEVTVVGARNVGGVMIPGVAKVGGAIVVGETV